MSVKTSNGALSHATTHDARVDFFFKVIRNTGDDQLIKLLKNAHKENIEDTIKLVFQLRDCRGGKGERKQFLNCIRWYAKNGYKQEVINLIGWIPYYGRWKDLLELLDLGGDFAEAVYTVFANALRSDKERLKQGQSISTAAKWAPTEGGEYDKKYGAASKIANKIGITMKTYRREYLVPMRTCSNVTEVWMCGGKWEEIPYEKVASLCMHKNKKVFLKHDSQGFNKYLELLKSGDQKINASQLFPHQLVSQYIKQSYSNTVDDVIEAQWKALVQHCRGNENTNLGKCLAVCDVSGSMTCNNGIPINVCVALGLLMAELTQEPFGNQIITFDTNPQFCLINGKTLRERVTQIMKVNWGGSTNLQKTFKLILDKCKKFKLSPAECPSTIFVFSDMQFNSCIEGSKNNELTNYQAIKKMYTDAGYYIPKIVFWNLNGTTTDFPATTEDSGVALVSGFSPSLMKLFIEGQDISPYGIMRQAIDDPRYTPISLTNTEPTNFDTIMYGKK